MLMVISIKVNGKRINAMEQVRASTLFFKTFMFLWCGKSSKEEM